MSAYATVAEANAYFDGRLYSTIWATACVSNKEKALAQAARIIDRLNFAGEKHTASDTRYALTGTRDCLRIT